MLPALLLTLAVQATPATTDRPAVVTNPQWLRRPSGLDLSRVWPRAGLNRSGEARLRCAVNTAGLLERCVVLSESPPGLGFGPAALLLTPNFQMSPRMVNGRPVEATVSLPIRFESTGEGAMPQVSDMAKGVEVLTKPRWAAAPTAVELAAAYPKAGTGPGQVVLYCAVDGANGLRMCDTVSATPGFEPAARKLVGRFKLELPDVGPGLRRKLRVNLPIHFQSPTPADNAPDVIRSPRWSRTLAPDKIQALFPVAAANAGLKSGRGVAECRVQPGGELDGCTVKSETPPDLGFGAAAVGVVDALALEPWTVDGRPVDGARIAVPVEFNLKPGGA